MKTRKCFDERFSVYLFDLIANFDVRDVSPRKCFVVIKREKTLETEMCFDERYSVYIFDLMASVSLWLAQKTLRYPKTKQK